MNFHLLTLFPEAIKPYFDSSLLGKAQEKGIVKIFLHQLRDYATDKHCSVDDRPYGGGSGMILKPDVVVCAVRDLRQKHKIDRVILLSPRGALFTQAGARELSDIQSVLLICGRYEGVDQRAIDLVVDEELSIGDYVLSGGELAAAVVVDAVARLIPGVLGNEKATLDESHTVGAHGCAPLLEYPHYTRPEEFEGMKVPEVLLSGNHAEIEKWRREESLKITCKNRPDLLKKK
ncbi:MAG: tRNA (guanosine(37)-N1)-methyltransferase TrmD [Deltaproteobacteria bacterium]|nr:tRNA (guanosine(37)-N1)-methyltransferase TrmD [Deltaproteobacteria bacterium]